MLSPAGQAVSIALERPGALWLALLVIPVVALYFLRMRFRRKEVGSTFIWRSLARSTTGGETLRRRSILLLLLQAAAVAAAAFAAAGPSILSRRVLEPGVAFLVDVSASMAVRDCAAGGKAASRVQAAAAAAAAEIDALGKGIPMALFACSDSARLLLGEPTLDKAAAKASLRELEAGSAAFDESACADGVSAALSRAEGSWSARVFTDGGLALGGARLSAAFDGALGAVLVGSSAASVGAAGLRLESSPGAGPRAAFSLWNGRAASADIEVRITRKGAVLASGTVRNLTKGSEHRAKPFPAFMRSIIEAGGLIEYHKQRMGER